MKKFLAPGLGDLVLIVAVYGVFAAKGFKTLDEMHGFLTNVKVDKTKNTKVYISTSQRLHANYAP